jgi:hypothetical protein
MPHQSGPCHRLRQAQNIGVYAHHDSALVCFDSESFVCKVPNRIIQYPSGFNATFGSSLDQVFLELYKISSYAHRFTRRNAELTR